MESVSVRPTHMTVHRRQARRLVLLTVMLAVPALATLFVSAATWPAFALPIMIALPLTGQVGLGVSSLAAASVFAVVAGRPAAGGIALTVGWVAFVFAALVVGTRYDKVQRDLTRVVGASLRDRLTGLYNFAFFSDRSEEHTSELQSR